MDRMLYIAMSGAKEVMLSQANNANNLANANTDGFKKILMFFELSMSKGQVGSREPILWMNGQQQILPQVQLKLLVVIWIL